MINISYVGGLSFLKKSASRTAIFGGALATGMIATMSVASAQSITVWSGFPELAPYYEHVAESMKEAYPDLNVEIEAIALREHEKRIALGLTSGSAGVTIVELSGPSAQRYLDNDLMAVAPSEIADFVTDPANFGEFFVDGASNNGTVYGVPLFHGQGALFYNLDMFEEAGLSGPPMTMQEYTDFANKLTQRDGDKPTVSGWSLRLAGGGQGIAEKFWINLFQFGGNVLEPAGDGKWRAAYANEAGRLALAQYLDILYTNNNLTIEMPADAEAFERGQTAMFIRESWVIGDIASKAPDLNYATAPLPHGSIALSVNLYVNTDEGDAADAAWAFAKAANEPENLVWLLDNVGWLPNRAGVDFSAVLDATPAMAAFVEYPDDYGFFTLPAIGPVAEILTRLAAQLTDAFGNSSMAGDDAAIDAFLAAAAQETNQILSREGLLAE